MWFHLVFKDVAYLWQAKIEFQIAVSTVLRKISSSSACLSVKLQAPLATVEEVTPSLRSSFASVYYNLTPYESDISVNTASSG
ncbi:unnamed protein product [Timema podura]|uniref:Uncharacterized protein n=1 Tax=Timema podura TaxID=61482 RepID=A0ABN7NR23_TIMPD|nr:unnamed protein product [Timema podura]